jgi:hypothetical protein
MARNQAAQNPTSENQNSDIPPDIPPTPGTPGQDEDKKEAPVVPSSMTVDQYLKRAPQSAGIGELVKSLYKTKIMSFGDWEKTVKTLLGKQIK